MCIGLKIGALFFTMQEMMNEAGGYDITFINNTGYCDKANYQCKPVVFFFFSNLSEEYSI